MKQASQRSWSLLHGEGSRGLEAREAVTHPILYLVTEFVRSRPAEPLALDLESPPSFNPPLPGCAFPNPLLYPWAPMKTVLMASSFIPAAFIAGPVLCLCSETNYPFFLCTKLKPQRTAENLGCGNFWTGKSCAFVLKGSTVGGTALLRAPLGQLDSGGLAFSPLCPSLSLHGI